nr:hypothetical protein [Tanacetum cinerariifolium]
MVIEKRVKDLQLGVESCQKKINITKPETTRLEEITKNIHIKYLPNRRWSIVEKKRPNIMIKAIDKQLKERRMIRSLGKFEPTEFILEFLSTYRINDMEMRVDVSDTLCFQLGGARHKMTWRQFILALGLHTKEEMTKARDFLRPVTSYIFIRDPVRRLCHMMIAYNISGRGKAPEKATVASAPGAVEDAPVVDEGAQANPAPIQAPQSSPPAPQHRIMTYRIEGLEKEMREL